jgi:hypothetical protein
VTPREIQLDPPKEDLDAAEAELSAGQSESGKTDADEAKAGTPDPKPDQTDGPSGVEPDSTKSASDEVKAAPHAAEPTAPGSSQEDGDAAGTSPPSDDSDK